MPRPHGHECQRRNICFDCQGRLRARRLDGFSEIMYDDGQRAFAAAVCRQCKLVHTELQEAPNVPVDFDKRLEALRKKAEYSPANYAVALWSKVVEKDGQYVERRYCVNLDGSVVTRLDYCDLRRTFNSFESDGWHAHEVKGKFKGVRGVLNLVEAALDAQGYRRLF